MDCQVVEHGVQPVLQALKDTPAQIASSTCYAHKGRPPSARSIGDEALTEQIKEVHQKNFEVYGARKVWHEMLRAGHVVARCTVQRLMREAGLKGVTRDKSPRTTRPAPQTDRPADLVDRDYTASRPNELWVADLTYVRTGSGWVYVAFVLEVYSRMILGWQISTNMYTELALDALQMGDLASGARRAGRGRPRTPQRPWSAVSGAAVHPAARGSGRGRVRGQQGRQL